MGDCCAKRKAMMVDLSQSINYQGNKTSSLSDISSARPVPRPVQSAKRDSRNDWRRTLESMIHQSWHPCSFLPEKNTDSCGLRIANLPMSENYQKILRCELL